MTGLRPREPTPLKSSMARPKGGLEGDLRLMSLCYEELAANQQPGVALWAVGHGQGGRWGPVTLLSTSETDLVVLEP